MTEGKAFDMLITGGVWRRGCQGQMAGSVGIALSCEKAVVTTCVSVLYDCRPLSAIRHNEEMGRSITAVCPERSEGWEGGRWTAVDAQAVVVA